MRTTSTLVWQLAILLVPLAVRTVADQRVEIAARVQQATFEVVDRVGRPLGAAVLVGPNALVAPTDLLPRAETEVSLRALAGGAPCVASVSAADPARGYTLLTLPAVPAGVTPLGRLNPRSTAEGSELYLVALALRDSRPEGRLLACRGVRQRPVVIQHAGTELGALLVPSSGTDSARQADWLVVDGEAGFVGLSVRPRLGEADGLPAAFVPAPEQLVRLFFPAAQVESLLAGGPAAAGPPTAAEPASAAATEPPAAAGLAKAAGSAAPTAPRILDLAGRPSVAHLDADNGVLYLTDSMSSIEAVDLLDLSRRVVVSHPDTFAGIVAAFPCQDGTLVVQTRATLDKLANDGKEIRNPIADKSRLVSRIADTGSILRALFAADGKTCLALAENGRWALCDVASFKPRTGFAPGALGATQDEPHTRYYLFGDGNRLQILDGNGAPPKEEKHAVPIRATPGRLQDLGGYYTAMNAVCVDKCLYHLPTGQQVHRFMDRGFRPPGPGEAPVVWSMRQPQESRLRPGQGGQGPAPAKAPRPVIEVLDPATWQPTYAYEPKEKPTQAMFLTGGKAPGLVYLTEDRLYVVAQKDLVSCRVSAPAVAPVAVPLFENAPSGRLELEAGRNWERILKPSRPDLPVQLEIVSAPAAFELVPPYTLRLTTTGVKWPVLGTRIHLKAKCTGRDDLDIRFWLTPKIEALPVPFDDQSVVYLDIPAAKLSAFCSTWNRDCAFVTPPPNSRVKSSRFEVQFDTFVVSGPKLVGVKRDPGALMILDLKAGKTAWEREQFGKGRIVTAGRGLDGDLLLMFSGDLKTATGMAKGDLLVRYDPEAQRVTAVHPLVAYRKQTTRRVADSIDIGETVAQGETRPDNAWGRSYQPLKTDGMFVLQDLFTGQVALFSFWSYCTLANLQEVAKNQILYDTSLYAVTGAGNAYEACSFANADSVYVDRQFGRLYVTIPKPGVCVALNAKTFEVIHVHTAEWDQRPDAFRVIDGNYLAHLLPHGYHVIDRKTSRSVAKIELPFIQKRSEAGQTKSGFSAADPDMATLVDIWFCPDHIVYMTQEGFFWAARE
jgi:hypothetical protein